jgi:hypothetical protein
MLEIDKNGNIKIARGDTFEVPLFINIDDDIFKDTRFPLKLNDEITFRLVESNMPNCYALLEKTFTYEDVNENNDIIIKFYHHDTCNLFPATYFYEIKLKRPNFKFQDESEDDAYITIVPRRKFVIQ